MTSSKAAASLGFIAPSSDPDAMLRRFRIMRRKLTPAIRRLELDWTCATEIMRRLAEYLTDGITVALPGARGALQPLLHVVLHRSLDAYQDAGREDDDVRLLVFAETAFSEAARLLAGQAVSDASSREWTACRGVPLLPWLEAARGVDRVNVVPAQRTGDAGRIAAALAQYSLTDRDRNILAGARNGR